jgi:hypothetical protein
LEIEEKPMQNFFEGKLAWAHLMAEKKSIKLSISDSTLLGGTSGVHIFDMEDQPGRDPSPYLPCLSL